MSRRQAASALAASRRPAGLAAADVERGAQTASQSQLCTRGSDGRAHFNKKRNVPRSYAGLHVSMSGGIRVAERRVALWLEAARRENGRGEEGGRGGVQDFRHRGVGSSGFAGYETTSYRRTLHRMPSSLSLSLSLYPIHRLSSISRSSPRSANARLVRRPHAADRRLVSARRMPDACRVTFSSPRSDLESFPCRPSHATPT
eukprot:350264-Chlamydomonas_euryale.AAC.2